MGATHRTDSAGSLDSSENRESPQDIFNYLTPNKKYNLLHLFVKKVIYFLSSSPTGVFDLLAKLSGSQPVSG